MATPTKMRAVVHSRYGTPDVLTVEEIDRPTPREDEVLIAVHAAGVSIGDHHIVTGKPYLVRLSPFGGFPAPKHRVPGAALAGTVEAVGAKVTRFRPGDEVYGQGANGAWAQYAVVKEELLSPKPKTLSFVQSAAVPWGTTALNGLRDVGQLQPGQRLLVNGASGAVGVWAVQIGKALGAHVTAVCSTRNVEMVRGLGADEIVDYTQADFVSGGARFDMMIDMVGNRSMAECRSVLVDKGAYIPCAAGRGDWIGPIIGIIWGLLSFAFGRRSYKMFIQKPSANDLAFMTALVDAAKARPVVEHTFAMQDIAHALTQVGSGHSRGVTVLQVVNDDVAAKRTS